MPPSFSTLLGMLAVESDEDVEAEDSRVFTVSPDSLANSHPYRLTIRETFNFENAVWREQVEVWGLRGLEEELEAYGLAEKHMAGADEDVAVDVHDLCV